MLFEDQLFCIDMSTEYISNLFFLPKQIRTKYNRKIYQKTVLYIAASVNIKTFIFYCDFSAIVLSNFYFVKNFQNTHPCLAV